MTGYLIIGALGALVLADMVSHWIINAATWRRLASLERGQQVSEWIEALRERRP